MKNPRALIVEDEPGIAELLAVNLQHGGFEAVICPDCAQARREISTVLPHLIVLDWMLPGESGIELARSLRRDSRTKLIPILMLTAKSEERDLVLGLDSGADDYLTKPFSGQELMARVRALIRRRLPELSQGPLSIGGLTIDNSSYKVSYYGQELKLGPTEFRLLNYLMNNPNRVHSRTQLLNRVWGDHVFIEERTVDVHIKRLREALGGASAMIETVRGAGYRLTGSGS